MISKKDNLKVDLIYNENKIDSNFILHVFEMTPKELNNSLIAIVGKTP